MDERSWGEREKAQGEGGRAKRFRKYWRTWLRIPTGISDLFANNLTGREEGAESGRKRLRKLRNALLGKDKMR